MVDYIELADYLAKKNQEWKESAWILVPLVYRIRITKDTNKLYVPHKICRSSKVSVVKCDAHLNHEELKVSRIRTKSIVLKKAVRKGEYVYISYWVWRFCREIILKAEDCPLVGDGSLAISI